MSLKSLMLHVLSASLVIAVTSASGCVDKETATLETPVQINKNITSQEAFTLIQNNQNNSDFMIIDVRSPKQFTYGHLENATNLDFYSQTFRNELSNLDKSKAYLVYCATGSTGCGSLDTSDIMAELNFREVYNMLGGINAWKAEGLPTVE